MTQETLVYAINFTIGAILAALMTHHWRRAGHGSQLGTWTLAAWTMTAADILFWMRPALPFWMARFFPTLMVTVGHAVLLLGAERTAGRARHVRTVVAVIAVHAVALAAFLAVGGSSGWRPVTNGLVWGGLSVAAFLTLRSAPADLRRTMAIPAYVFLGHGLFHAMRISLAASVALHTGTTGAAEWLQVMGDVEVSFFMVALFVSLLAAHLQLRNEELRSALRDVKELAQLLPICSWCRKVRSDDGYWQQLEQYFLARQGVQFTHSICENCAREHFEETGAKAGG